MISITNKPNTTTPTGAFPHGDIKDDTGANDGTPVSRQVYGDSHQFFQELMNRSGIVPNNLPDNSSNNYQLVDAFAKYVKNIIENNTTTKPNAYFENGVRTGNTAVITDVYEIGVWNMDTTASINIPLINTDYTKVVSVDVTILDDGNFGVFSLAKDNNDVVVINGSNTCSVFRNNGGFFDSPNYDDATQNRGYVKIIRSV